MTRILSILAGVVIGALSVWLLIGSVRDPNFWFTADQRGQNLEDHHQFHAAAQRFDDPMRQGVAYFRGGDFKESAAAFAQDGGDIAAYDKGNALLMHGAYDDSIKAYDLALSLHPNWQAALENRALAVARKERIENVPDDMTGGQEDPDSVLVHDISKSKRAKPVEINAGDPISNEQLQAAWLRRVQTKPADFLHAKFTYQLQKGDQAP